MRMSKSLTTYDVARLQKDRKKVESKYSYTDGTTIHSISLLTREMVIEPYKEYLLNVPYTGAIHECDYFREIYDSFKTDILGMVLLERKPRTSYRVHLDKAVLGVTDTSMSKNVVRFQIPIVTNAQCYLCVTDYSNLSEIGGKNGGNIRFKNKNEFVEHSLFAHHHTCFTLEAGFLYHFDSRKLHTLFNDGDTVRVTLLLALMKNEWLKDWMEKNLYAV